MNMCITQKYRYKHIQFTGREILLHGFVANKWGCSFLNENSTCHTHTINNT